MQGAQRQQILGFRVQKFGALGFGVDKKLLGLGCKNLWLGVWGSKVFVEEAPHQQEKHGCAHKSLLPKHKKTRCLRNNCAIAGGRVEQFYCMGALAWMTELHRSEDHALKSKKKLSAFCCRHIRARRVGDDLYFRPNATLAVFAVFATSGRKWYSESAGRHSSTEQESS